jgi:Rho-binding antiterminator
MLKIQVHSCFIFNPIQPFHSSCCFPNMKTDYRPISCDIYDHIEIFAMRKKVVEIEYRDEADQVHQINTRILDTKVANKEEFIVLENGQYIRMDYLVRIEDVYFPQPGEGWQCF